MAGSTWSVAGPEVDAITPSSSVFLRFAVLGGQTIGKTVKTALNGDVQTSFPALTLSQSKYKMDSFYLVRRCNSAFTRVPLSNVFRGNAELVWECELAVVQTRRSGFCKREA